MEHSGIYKGLPIAIPIMVLMAGCANTDETADSNYGQSVRHMIAVQTASPRSGATGLDGQMAALSLQNYRTDVATRKEVGKATEIAQDTTNLGGNTKQ